MSAGASPSVSRFGAAIFLALAFAVFFRPAFTGQVMFPAGFLMERLPIAPEPGEKRPFKHVLMGDIIQEMYPWQLHAREEWRNGRVPLWLHSSLGGMPFVANNQSAAFFPGTLLAVAFPRSAQMTVLAMFKLAVAAAGMVLLLGRWKLSLPARAAGAVAFTFSWMMMFWLQWPFATTAATLPWIILGVEVVRDRPGVRGAALLAGAVGFSFLAGSAETTAQLLFAAAIFLFLRVALPEDATVPEQGKRPWSALPWALLGVAAGTLLAGIQLVPFVELLPRTWIWESRGWHSTAFLPKSLLWMWFSPNAMGNPAWELPGGVSGWTKPVHWQTGYVGIAALALAAPAFVDRERRRLVIALAVVAVIFIGVGYGLGPHHIAGRIPLLAKAPHHRMITIASFAIAALAAIGIDRLMRDEARRARIVVVATALAGAGLAILGTRFLEGPLSTIQRSWPSLAGAVAIAASAWFLAARDLRRGWAWLLPGIAFVEIFAVMGNYNPWSDPRYVYPRTGAMEPILRETGGFFAAFGGSVPPVVSAAYGIRDLRTYDPMVTARWRRFYDRFSPATAGGGMTLNPLVPDPDWARMAGVDRFLLPTVPAPNAGWKAFQVPTEAAAVELHGRAVVQRLRCDEGVLQQLQVGSVGASVRVAVQTTNGRALPVAQVVPMGSGSALVRLDQGVSCPASVDVVLGATSEEVARFVLRRTSSGHGAHLDGGPADAAVPASAFTQALRGDRIEWLGGLGIVHDREARPFAWIAERIVRAADEGAADAALAAAIRDPDRWAVLETADGPADAPLEPGEEARARRMAPGHVVIEAKTARERWLVLQESHDPGWEITVDGKPVEPVIANLVFQAVPLGPGTHEVVMRYRPASFRWGMAASAAGLAFVALGLGSTKNRRRRHSSPGPAS